MIDAIRMIVPIAHIKDLMQDQIAAHNRTAAMRQGATVDHAVQVAQTEEARAGVDQAAQVKKGHVAKAGHMAKADRTAKAETIIVAVKAARWSTEPAAHDSWQAAARNSIDRRVQYADLRTQHAALHHAITSPNIHSIVALNRIEALDQIVALSRIVVPDPIVALDRIVVLNQTVVQDRLVVPRHMADLDRLADLTLDRSNASDMRLMITNADIARSAIETLMVVRHTMVRAYARYRMALIMMHLV